MAGEIDVYQVCPCGSGKKLKFCCHAIVGEMQKIGDMQAHHQYQMALSALESLEKKDLKEVWSRAWVKSIKAMIQSTLKNFEDSRRLVREVLEELPEHPIARSLNALLTLGAEGYPAAKRAIYSALQVKPEQRSLLTAHLVRVLAESLVMQGHTLAAREYLTLAFLFDPENQESVKEFLEFEGNTALPYPLRSGYPLAKFAGEESLRARHAEAEGLAALGCFSDAAKAFGAIARQMPDNPGVWWNIALCHAWAGEDPLAVQAFRAAAANQSDPESAADCLLLARLLDPPTGAARVDRLKQEYRIPSAGKLLTVLDQHPFYARAPLTPEEAEDEDRPAAWYQVLDRESSAVKSEELTVDNVPRVLGQIFVWDADSRLGMPARAIVGALGREAHERLTQDFVKIAAGDVEPAGEPEVVGFGRAEAVALMRSWWLPSDLPPGMTERLSRARWDKLIGEVWPNVPQHALGGKTPLEASRNPELNVALRAAVLALDVYCEQSGFMLDQPSVRRALGLPPVTPLDSVADDTILLMSILQLRRVPLDRLTDEQLVKVANRFTRLEHSALSYQAILAVLARPELARKVNTPRLYMSLANLSRRQYRSDQVLEWLTKGKHEAKARKEPLEALLSWELEELVLRGENPDDPQLMELATTLWKYYRPKLPNASELIAGLLNQLALPGPWNSAQGTAHEPEALATAVPSGGLWTPDTPAAAGEPSKLWLPGQ